MITFYFCKQWSRARNWSDKVLEEQEEEYVLWILIIIIIVQSYMDTDSDYSGDSDDRTVPIIKMRTKQ